jgi:ElaB/YqjD/DUF883 family membrane-anchored ribosome-binding protein
MAEAWRSDAAGRSTHYPPGAPESHDFPAEPQLPLPELPAPAIPASSPALNRSAEALGRGMGNAVAGVRRLPQQIDKLRSRIHLVSGRDRVAIIAEDVRESAVERAEEWRDAAEESLAELKQRADLYADELAGNAHQYWRELRTQSRCRINALRREARQWLATARRWESEQPLRVIGCCAATAFVAGVALRIWRSDRD